MELPYYMRIRQFILKTIRRIFGTQGIMETLPAIEKFLFEERACLMRRQQELDKRLEAAHKDIINALAIQHEQSLLSAEELSKIREGIAAIPEMGAKSAARKIFSSFYSPLFNRMEIIAAQNKNLEKALAAFMSASTLSAQYRGKVSGHRPDYPDFFSLYFLLYKKGEALEALNRQVLTSQKGVMTGSGKARALVSPETRFLVVFGMHRSGTSLLSRALRVFGAEHGDNLFPAANDNPRGYWEDVELMKLDIAMLKSLDMKWDTLSAVTDEHVDRLISAGFLDRALKFLFEKAKNAPIVALKEPRMTRLAPFWRVVFQEAGIAPHCLIAFRHPHDVSASLSLRNQGASHTLVSEHCYNYYLWLGYTLSALINTDGWPRVLVKYDQLLADPESMLKKIGRKLDLEILPGEMESFIHTFIDRNLNHAASARSNCAEDATIPQRVRLLYDLLESGSHSLECPTLFDAGPQWPDSEDERQLAAALDKASNIISPNEVF